MNVQQTEFASTELVSCYKEFNANGYVIRNNFLEIEECDELLDFIEAYRKLHQVPHIYRKTQNRSLNYHVIDGERIKLYLPKVEQIYYRVNHVVNQMIGQRMVPLTNTKVGCNINITSPGGEYRWHYDRNSITAILYLNEVQGGETECYPNYRIYLEKLRYSSMQNG